MGLSKTSSACGGRIESFSWGLETLAWVEACVGGAENMERARTPRRPNFDFWRFPRGPGKVWKILGGFEAAGSPETGKTPKTSTLNHSAPLCAAARQERELKGIVPVSGGHLQGEARGELKARLAIVRGSSSEFQSSRLLLLLLLLRPSLSLLLRLLLVHQPPCWKERDSSMCA